MLFNWWKKKDRPPSDEWPQFVDNLTDSQVNPSLSKPRLRNSDEQQARVKTNEDIVAAARLVY